MPVLSWDKPKKLRSKEDHEKMHSSDSEVPGTYVPNMSNADRNRWKARYVGGEEPRVEIRRTINGVQTLTRVSRASIKMSANGTVEYTWLDYQELSDAIDEAIVRLAVELEK